MKVNSRSAFRSALLISFILIITVGSSRLRADTGTCGGATTTLPFTDVMSSPFFCQIAEAFFSGLTNGTAATSYSPSQNVTREQMAAFVTRTMDQSLRRGSTRAARDQYWTPTSGDGVGSTAVASGPIAVKSDGADLWVASLASAKVSRVRASDGKLLETWTGAGSAKCILAAKGLIFVTADTDPGKVYQIDPTQPMGAVTTLTSSLGASPAGISFDGARIWTANQGAPGSVSIVTLNPVNVTTITAGFSTPFGILYDGANIWITDVGNLSSAGNLIKLSPSGAIVLSVAVGDNPQFPIFDGTNIWVPNFNSGTVTVVRASTGVVVATLTGNGLNNPKTAAFDGERILVTNQTGNSVSLWKASDLTPLGSVSVSSVPSSPAGACSDGQNFWITLAGTGKLSRF